MSNAKLNRLNVIAALKFTIRDINYERNRARRKIQKQYSLTKRRFRSDFWLKKRYPTQIETKEYMSQFNPNDEHFNSYLIYRQGEEIENRCRELIALFESSEYESITVSPEDYIIFRSHYEK